MALHKLLVDDFYDDEYKLIAIHCKCVELARRNAYTAANIQTLLRLRAVGIKQITKSNESQLTKSIKVSRLSRFFKNYWL